MTVRCSELISPCPLCGGRRTALPALGPPAMASDGRCVPVALRKADCDACGAVSQISMPAVDEIRSIYGDDYSLGSTPGAPEETRAAVYARALATIAEDLGARSVLDIGCGSGAVLAALGRLAPGLALRGIEAAPAAVAAGRARGLHIERAFAEELAAGGAGHDLVYAVNVIEHTVDPALFLKAAAARLSPGGRLALVLPDGLRPNLELMFFDHLWTLPPGALTALAARQNLQPVAASPLPSEAGDFRLVVLKHSAAPIHETPVSPPLPRHDYFAAWAKLDERLSSAAPDGPLSAFGAGEAAALLRCYAPRTWARVGRLCVDDVSGAWDLGRPVESYARLSRIENERMIIATHPRHHRRLAMRLEADGHRVIAWDAWIER